MATCGYMKRKIKDTDLPKASGPWMVQEAQAAYSTRDEVSVRAAKDQLSALLERASRGEEIVITSDGQPKAMIVRYRPVIVGLPAASRRALRNSMPMSADSTRLIRAERDSGY